MNLVLLGEILQVLGTLTIGYMALSVHRHVKHEKKIDEAIFRFMTKEQRIGWIALVLIAVGFILERVG